MRQAHANRELRIISSLPTKDRAWVILGKILAEIARAQGAEADRHRGGAGLMRKLLSQLMLFHLADRLLARPAPQVSHIDTAATARRSIRAFLSHPPAGWSAP
ncbi:MAG: hypothetical protein KGJ57_21770 [Sphingomonadales bacterium]|nr:hypothetical protein [Sphingomonadales bacterium]MDE2172022.1 hypothetical protein [Sphingomonadales bacterium]